MTNEQLCSLAREGNKAAEEALIENVMPSIRITASNIQKRYSAKHLSAIIENIFPHHRPAADFIQF